MDYISHNKRSAYWDNIKGILILLVVFAHLSLTLQQKSYLIDKAVEYIYMFHMPAFVYVSGYFGKSNKSRSFESIVKLVILFIVFHNISGIIFGFQSLLIPMYSYWYLIALVIWRLTTPYLTKIKYIELIMFITALLVGFFHDIDNTFAVARIICFYPYYLFGYKLSDDSSNKLIGYSYYKRVLFATLIFIFVCVFAFFANYIFSYSLDSLQMFCYVGKYDVWARAALYIIAFSVIYVLRMITPDKEISLLTTFGRYSLCIFILHRLVVIWLSDFYAAIYLCFPFIITLITSFAICMLFGNSYVEKYMNIFIDGGVQIFSREAHKKFNFSLFVMVFIYLYFVFLAIYNYIK